MDVRITQQKLNKYVAEGLTVQEQRAEAEAVLRTEQGVPLLVQKEERHVLKEPGKARKRLISQIEVKDIDQL